MTTDALDNRFWDWVDAHISDDPIRLRLKYAKVNDGIDYDAAIRQIECRRRFGKKLQVTLDRTPRFYFPSKLSGEQSTSDRLAAYHATLVRENEPLIDLTSGLGIDVMHCAPKCSSATAVERSEALADALRYNAAQSHCDRLDVICGDCREIVSRDTVERYGTAFIDPARRSDDGSRVYSLADCEPDVVAMLPDLERICRRLIVKMSPMLDISHTVSTLGGCTKIISLGNPTECKELIAVKDFGTGSTDSQTIIEGITLLPQGEAEFRYTASEEASCAIPAYTLPSRGDFFYEPYPSIMKLGANRLLASRYELDAIHPNSRLYHSDKLDSSFPGNIFKVEAVIDYSSSNLKRFKRDYPVINVAARNFGISAEALRSKLGVKDGGDKRVIGVTDSSDRRHLIVLAKL